MDVDEGYNEGSKVGSEVGRLQRERANAVPIRYIPVLAGRRSAAGRKKLDDYSIGRPP